MLETANIEWDETEEALPDGEDRSSLPFFLNGLVEFYGSADLFFKNGFEFMKLRFQSLRRVLQLHKLVPLRYRYIFSRSGRVRLRYSAGFSAFVCLALFFAAYPFVSNFSLSSSALSADVIAADSSDVNIVESEVAAATERLQADNPNLSESMRSRVSQTMRMASALIKKPKKPRHQVLEIGSGETIAGVLQEAGVGGQDAFKTVKALSKHYNPRNVKAGQTLKVEFKPDEEATKEAGEEVLQFAKLSMKLSPVKDVVIERDGDGFESSVQEKALEERTYGRQAKIETSLYGSAAKAGIPSAVIAEMIRIYSWNVDFQRDIRRGDAIEVLYKAYETEDGDYAKYGNVLYASLSVGGKSIPIYRYKMANGDVDYFEPNGQSIKKTLMKTPIDGARISSGFGMRRHPVLGYNKMHKGMDFAASTGTPIYAAGKGTISYKGRKGGYGNYIKIRHNSSLSTAYAHMHKFAKGIKNGSRVKQGQVIGYVGTTGRSTGPHLHYEVVMNGKQVNPNRVDLPTGEQLKGKELKKFKSVIGGVHEQYVELRDGIKFASLEKR